MMEVFYTREHEWIMIEGPVGVVGITEYAVQQLGDITFIELPPVGKEIKQFDLLSSIESVKAASDIYAPLSGKVIAINEILDSQPEIINESPEENGWIARIEIIDPAGKGKLLNRQGYEDYVRGLA
jgi:glycine cleavage system H protein